MREERGKRGGGKIGGGKIGGGREAQKGRRKGRFLTGFIGDKNGFDEVLSRTESYLEV